MKPDRATKSAAVREAPWWQFWRTRQAMRSAIAGSPSVIVMTRISKAVMPAYVSSQQVISDGVVVFGVRGFDQLAILSSSVHQLWAIKNGSSLESRVIYSLSDVFETFPRPRSTELLFGLGETLNAERRTLMLEYGIGQTKLYNLVNDPAMIEGSGSSVSRLRQIHVDLDEAVMSAYGWDDISLDHGFYTYRQVTRWTVSPAARVEILDRLLEENHRRAALEAEQAK